VLRLFILKAKLKYLLSWYSVTVKIAFKSGSHPEVIYEEWVLVNVLKQAELPSFK